MATYDRNRFTIRTISSNDGTSLTSLLHSMDELLLEVLSRATKSDQGESSSGEQEATSHAGGGV